MKQLYILWGLRVHNSLTLIKEQDLYLFLNKDIIVKCKANLTVILRITQIHCL